MVTQVHIALTAGSRQVAASGMSSHSSSVFMTLATTQSGYRSSSTPRCSQTSPPSSWQVRSTCPYYERVFAHIVEKRKRILKQPFFSDSDSDSDTDSDSLALTLSLCLCMFVAVQAQHQTKLLWVKTTPVPTVPSLCNTYAIFIVSVCDASLSGTFASMLMIVYHIYIIVYSYYAEYSRVSDLNCPMAKNIIDPFR